MDITIGTRLRDFAVVSSLGAGGMGEVFRAQDVNLGREVALKVLPDAFAEDQSRRARFVREAKALAALSHPGIASIYEFFEHEGRFVLIMELVEGETLDQALRRGAMPMTKGLDVALQIAEAIEHAHARGILHRDLKPANIQVTAAGRVKLLDFGLARVLDPASADGDAATTAGELTHPRAVIGTPAYMSPEQARGERVDRRSDIFSFGSVVFEILTATRAFSGKTSSDSLVAVLDREPAWERLPRETPSTIRGLLRRCLQKDPNRRLHDIADARIILQESPNERAASDTDPARRGSQTRWTLAGAVAVLAILMGGFVAWNLQTPREPAAPAAKITLALATDNSMNLDGGIAISPDGQTLVFAVSSATGLRLYARRLDEWEPRALAGTDGARNPFFSPDGNSVAFVRDGLTIEKIRLSGGPPQVICRVAGVRGGSWGSDGTIIFGGWPNAGLWRVSADGGSPVPLSLPSEGSAGVTRYVWPHQLPDSKVVILTIVRPGQMSIAALQANGELHTLVESGSHPHYLESGHLVYLMNGNLTAVAFDVQRLQTRGGATALVENVRQDLMTVDYGVSSTGVLAYVPRGSTVDRLVWKDRQGTSTPLDLHPRRYESANLSPDGKRFSATVLEGSKRNVWIGNVDREPLAPLTFGDDDTFGAWTWDSARLAFSSGQGGAYNMFWARTDGSGKPERLTESPHSQKPTSWSRASDVLLFNDIDPSTGLDIWELSVASKVVHPLVRTRYREMEAVFSPNGKWIAYQSEESGRYEVWAQAYPPGRRIQISTEGGSGPMWRGDGHELFYQTETEMMAVAVMDPNNLQVGRPTRLFKYSKGIAQGRGYDVSSDGQRFLLIERAAGIPSRLNLVLNWSDEVRKAVRSVQP